MRHPIALSILLMSTAAAHAAESLSLKGLRAGLSVAQVRAMHPAMKCSEPDQQGISSCRFENTMQFERAPDLESLAGFPSQAWAVNFFDGKLDKVQVSFYEDVSEKVIAALAEKYGKPRVASVPMHNRMGAKWNDSVYEWTRNGDTISVVRLGFEQGPASVTFTSAAYNRRAAAAAKETENKRAKDL